MKCIGCVYVTLLHEFSLHCAMTATFSRHLVFVESASKSISCCAVWSNTLNLPLTKSFHGGFSKIAKIKRLESYALYDIDRWTVWSRSIDSIKP